jgi:hypothetical protein
MLSKMAGMSMLVGHMLGVKSTVPTTIKNVDVEISVYLVFGALRKMQEIMRNKFAE